MQPRRILGAAVLGVAAVAMSDRPGFPEEVEPAAAAGEARAGWAEEARAAGSAAVVAPSASADSAEEKPPEARFTPEPDAAADGPCPAEMAHIGKACMDRYEAHLVVVTKEGEVRHPHHERPERGVRYEARSAKGVFPQGYISQREAKQACENAGKRLCSWLEWRRACQGTRWYRYPYGYRYRKGVCNVGKKHLLGELFGENPKRWSTAMFNDPRLNQEPGYLARSGEHEGCASPDGIYDLAGNLHEWVSNRVNGALLSALRADRVPREGQPYRRGNGVFVGGFYSTLHEHGPGCTYATYAHERSYHDYSTGFRCCRDAPPERDDAAP